MSDHSSHFDSVLGTAINLGIHSVNEKGSLTHPKVSVLAREAKELQGVRSPPSPSPVPPAQAPVAAAPKKDEGTDISSYCSVLPIHDKVFENLNYLRSLLEAFKKKYKNDICHALINRTRTSRPISESSSKELNLSLY